LKLISEFHKFKDLLNGGPSQGIVGAGIPLAKVDCLPKAIFIATNDFHPQADAEHNLFPAPQKPN
jgi:hypothetical protein